MPAPRRPIRSTTRPALLDRYLAKTGYSSQQTGDHADPDRPNNLWQPQDAEEGADHGAHGTFDDHAVRHDPELWLSHHVGATCSALATIGTAAIAAGRRDGARDDRIGVNENTTRTPPIRGTR